MKYLSPYRIACYLLVLFCAAHTFGGMFAEESFGVKADAVFASMKSVQFSCAGAHCTWYGFWFGFGLTVSLFLLVSAIIAWQLDKVTSESWSAVSVIAWALFAIHACNAVISWVYFFAAPGVLQTLVAVLLGVGALKKQRQAARRVGVSLD
jgi:hypothetical protein